MKRYKQLKTAKSPCPACLEILEASVVEKGSDVFMKKTCPQHGRFETILWRGEPSYTRWGTGQEAPGPRKNLSESLLGCPHDCGLCTEHKAQTCTVLMEVTRQCDMRCPICFAGSTQAHLSDPDLNQIRDMLEAVLASTDPCPLQISGGEPCVRDDLAAIVSMAKRMGFPHVQVNTNGLRLAADKTLVERLKDAGLDLIYLQFDGVTDDVYRRIRGTDLVDLKEKVIRNCAEAKLGVQLVPTLVPGINTHQLGAIVQFAKRWIPVVKGIHFQPIAYFGRYPLVPTNEERVTIPEVLRALESQTLGEIKVENFLPRRRRDSHCGFSGFFVLDEHDNLKPTTFFRTDDLSCTGCGDSQSKQNPSEHVRKFIQERSVFVEPCPCCAPEGERPQGDDEMLRFFERTRTHYLSLSGMPFQDAWTLDLDRLQGCCIHVISPRSKRLIPFCAYYLTNIHGLRLPGKGF